MLKGEIILQIEMSVNTSDIALSNSSHLLIFHINILHCVNITVALAFVVLFIYDD